MILNQSQMEDIVDVVFQATVILEEEISKADPMSMDSVGILIMLMKLLSSNPERKKEYKEITRMLTSRMQNHNSNLIMNKFYTLFANSYIEDTSTTMTSYGIIKTIKTAVLIDDFVDVKSDGFKEIRDNILLLTLGYVDEKEAKEYDLELEEKVMEQMSKESSSTDGVLTPDELRLRCDYLLIYLDDPMTVDAIEKYYELNNEEDNEYLKEQVVEVKEACKQYLSNGTILKNNKLYFEDRVEFLMKIWEPTFNISVGMYAKAFLEELRKECPDDYDNNKLFIDDKELLEHFIGTPKASHNPKPILRAVKNICHYINAYKMVGSLNLGKK